MPTLDLTIDTIKSNLEHAQLAGYIYQYNPHLLVLQEDLNEDGSVLNNFVQHGLTADQIGLQFGLRLLDNKFDFLIGATHSNQDRSYEIGARNLKADQKAFNLLYAFYNYPKAFYLIILPLAANSAQFKEAMESQLFNQPKLDFLNTALKTNPMGQQFNWMKSFIVQQALDMKVRMQTCLN
ncbi:hypothetical protein E0H80_01600 [Acinetobacter sp. ANC 4779]|uniref:hypothetical protein n=1 Tax=Acinetobacter sp. ANC 4779 TaxID=2529848 RepID=UPI00103F57A0|nr:hypothetical protein [Acinetobacter sp. ANC 4779]TCB52568.1 hypothetical protein E0H80_01600 [Acinetobacter sp. ANC 4779]